MNNHQISQLDFKTVVELFGAAYESFSLNQIVLLDEATGSFQKDEGIPIKLQKSIIACRVIKLDIESDQISVSKIWRYYPDGSSRPEEGEDIIKCGILRKSVDERLKDIDALN